MDGLRDSSGLFGVARHPEAAHRTVLGLHGLQHRGGASMALAVADGEPLCRGVPERHAHAAGIHDPNALDRAIERHVRVPAHDDVRVRVSEGRCDTVARGGGHQALPAHFFPRLDTSSGWACFSGQGSVLVMCPV